MLSKLLVLLAMTEAEAPSRLRARSVEWPGQDELAKLLEADAGVRECFRANKAQLLSWPSPQLVGVASLKALSLNVGVIKLALQVWGNSCDFPKAMAIDWLKREALNIHIYCMHVVLSSGLSSLESPSSLRGWLLAQAAVPRCHWPVRCCVCGCLGDQAFGQPGN